LLVPAGYWFGNMPLVRDHFEIVVLVIVAMSLVPIAVEYLRHRATQKRV
jgi:membrane-associated protein